MAVTGGRAVWPPQGFPADTDLPRCCAFQCELDFGREGADASQAGDVPLPRQVTAVKNS